MRKIKRYAVSTTIQELMAIKMALGFFRRNAPRRGIIHQRVCRLEPEVDLKIEKLQKLEKKRGLT